MYIRRQPRDPQDRINNPETFDDLYERAKEHDKSRARTTFVAPKTLMHLIKVQESFGRLLRLIEAHWEDAQHTQGGGYNDRDLVLWAQALGWFDRKPE